MTNTDLSREIDKMTSEFSDLLESTVLTSPRDLAAQFPDPRSGAANMPG
jgi:hypothetical protein